MARRRLSKVDVLRYALLGVRNEIGHNTGNPFMRYEEMAEMEDDEREIERRLKLTEIAERKKDDKGKV